jgi:hypothetical protein
MQDFTRCGDVRKFPGRMRFVSWRSTSVLHDVRLMCCCCMKFPFCQRADPRNTGNTGTREHVIPSPFSPPLPFVCLRFACASASPLKPAFPTRAGKERSWSLPNALPSTRPCRCYGRYQIPRIPPTLGFVIRILPLSRRPLLGVSQIRRRTSRPRPHHTLRNRLSARHSHPTGASHHDQDS